MKVRVKLKGLAEAKKQTREELQLAREAVAGALYVAGNVVMTEAKRRAPLDTGVLRASGYVTLPEAGEKPKVEVGFGGAAAAYALVQHERTELKHEVGEAKYLENAINATDVQGIIAAESRRRIASGDRAIEEGENLTKPEGE